MPVHVPHLREKLALLQVLADFEMPAEPVEHRLRQQLEVERQRGGCRRPQMLKVLQQVVLEQTLQQLVF